MKVSKNDRYYPLIRATDGTFVYRCAICGKDYDTEEQVKDHLTKPHNLKTDSARFARHYSKNWRCRLGYHRWGDWSIYPGWGEGKKMRTCTRCGLNQSSTFGT